MKKISFFMLNFLAAAFCLFAENGGSISFFKGLDFYWLGTYSAPEKFSFGDGVKLSLKGFEARAFYSAKSLDWDDLAGEKAHRYSLSFDGRDFNSLFDLNISLGSLSLGSSMSVSPLYSGLTPFAAKAADAGGLRASKPSMSSAKKEDALYARAGLRLPKGLHFGEVHFLPFSIEGACLAKDFLKARSPVLFAGKAGFLYRNYLKVTEGFFYRRYCVEETFLEDEIWWEKIPVRFEGAFNSFANETAFELPFFKSKTTLCATEQKKSPVRYWLREECSVTTKYFDLNGQAWFSDNFFNGNKIPFLLLNGDECKKLWQAKIIPTIKLPLHGKAVLKIGAGGLVEEKILDFGKNTECRSLEGKFALGFKRDGLDSTCRLVFSAGNFVFVQSPAPKKTVDFPKFSAAVTYSTKTGGKSKGRIYVYGAASFLPARDSDKNEYSERLKISFSPGKSFVKNAGFDILAEEKKSGIRISPGAFINLLFAVKKVRVNAGITMKYSSPLF